MFSLSLPGIEVKYSLDISDPVLLVAGGRRPDPAWLGRVLPIFGRRWCADSGLRPCLEAGCIPDRLIGDADSTPPDLWRSASEAGALVTRHPQDKDLTDLQLALQTISKEIPGATVVVTGCWGGRFDHMYSNVFSAVWAREIGTRVLAFVDDRECMFLLEGEGTLDISADSAEAVLSLLPITFECRGVCIKNTKWELEDSLLSQMYPYSISNRTESGLASVKVQKGILGVYYGWLREW